MVRPSKPKEIKPKAEVSADENGAQGGGASSGGGVNSLVTSIITTVVICVLFLGVSYFIQDKLLTDKLAKIGAAQTGADGEAAADGEDGGGEGDTVEKGVILDLGEFILNLSDPNSRRYLKADVAIELSKSPNDPAAEEAKPAGGHGEGAAPDPQAEFEKEMEQFKPAIRDSIISTLSSKTPEELATVSGKELAKEQIKEAVNSIFGGEREVMRVSFGSFIIQ